MDNCAVIGNGVVGSTTGDIFGIKKRFDLVAERCNCTLNDVAKCRFVFICLPTNINQEGKYDVSAIESIIKQIISLGADPIFIMRSTVWPGFADFLMHELHVTIISNPEFLSEASALKDAKNPPFVLLGGPNDKVIDQVKALYQGRIKYHEFILTNNITAEMSKLALNSWFATKVIFANQLYDISRKFKINYERVKEVMEKHPFGPRNHFTVWYKGKRGVQGRCLPKDTKALAAYTNMEILKVVLELNERYATLTENNEL